MSTTAAGGWAASIRRPSASTSICRRRECRRPAVRPPSTTTAKAGFGRPRRTERCDSILRPRPSPSSNPSPTRPRTAPAGPMARPAIATATAGWAEMTLDIIGKGDSATGKPQEVKLASVQEEMDRVSADARKFYETYNQPDFNNPFPWAQGPRRMGTDKNADVLWVGNSWGANFA